MDTAFLCHVSYRPDFIWSQDSCMHTSLKLILKTVKVGDASIFINFCCQYNFENIFPKSWMCASLWKMILVGFQVLQV